MRKSELEIPQFEQRANIKFCQKLGKTAAEAFEMMQQGRIETEKNRDKTGQKARSCLNSFFIQIELFI